MPPSPITKVLGRLSICSNADLPFPLPSSMPGTMLENTKIAFLQIMTNGHSRAEPAIHQASNYLQIEAHGGKKGQLQFLQRVLPQSMAFISYHLDAGAIICICCDTGKDSSIGVALAALQIYFDYNGRLIAKKDRPGIPRKLCPFRASWARTYSATNTVTASKSTIKTRLQWIITSCPQANPSRATLKRVNEFLLTPASFNRTIVSPVVSSM